MKSSSKHYDCIDIDSPSVQPVPASYDEHAAIKPQGMATSDYYVCMQLTNAIIIIYTVTFSHGMKNLTTSPVAD